MKGRAWCSLEGALEKLRPGREPELVRQTNVVALIEFLAAGRVRTVG
jgi:hypothetical protein